MSKNPTSISLSASAKAALTYLKGLPGGFNLNQLVNQFILAEARRRGWKGEKDVA